MESDGLSGVHLFPPEIVVNLGHGTTLGDFPRVVAFGRSPEQNRG